MSTVTAPVEHRAARFLSALSPRRLSAVYLLALFLVVFTLLNPGIFLTGSTMTVILGTGAVTCMLALAFLVPLTTENYDLSIGVMLTFALTLVTQLDLSFGWPIILSAVVTLVACALVGALSGFIVVRLHVNSFIATLGVSQVLLAILLLFSGNRQLVGKFPAAWTSLGNATILSVPLPFYMVLAIAVVLWYVLEHTGTGRFMFATGGNPEAARLSGVNTQLMVWGSFVASAVIAGFAGLVYSMQIGVATSTVGDGLLFPAVAAVFLGASQLSMRPNVWGTILAYLALAVGIQGLRLSLGATAAWASPAFQGTALIIAVAIASRPIAVKLRAGRSTGEPDASSSSGSDPVESVR